MQLFLLSIQAFWAWSKESEFSMLLNQLNIEIQIDKIFIDLSLKL